MSLLKIDISAVRNIESLSISPSPTINFIYGANASGKSALLESIFILGRAKSFRCSNIKSVIHYDQPYLRVAGLTESHAGTCPIGIQMDGKAIDIRINLQTTQKRSDLAAMLPLQLIHPKSYELLDAGPQFRREFLDWGVFHQFEIFLSAWRSYKRALAQRNFLLKAKSIAQINVWNRELVYYGTIVDDLRQRYLQSLLPIATGISRIFLNNIEDINLTFLAGWDTNKSFEQTLINDLEKDIRYGFTHSGPHRSEFQLSVGKRLAKDFVSRGQLKLLVLSLKLAQVQLLTNNENNPASVLIDDFAAELDRVNRAKLLDYLVTMKCQVFITATDINDFGNFSQLPAYKMFHMEHGHINQM